MMMSGTTHGIKCSKKDGNLEAAISKDTELPGLEGLHKELT